MSQAISTSPPKAKTRPKLFRALGDSQPPATIDIDYQVYRRVKTIKHDSWAATALYESTGQNPGHKVVCKFNRIQPIGWIPMRWLGRRLAHRESTMYLALEDIPSISKGFQKVSCCGEVLPNACAHEYIEGHPLRWHDRVRDDFFDQLELTLRELHRRNIAYVDMNKSENVIVNEQGDPCLIDFQISVRWNQFWLRGILKLLQRSDLYHCAKMKRRFRPDLVEGQAGQDIRPWWIRAHRKIATPFRATRRRLLVWLGVRKGTGKPQSEAFIEEALRAPCETKSSQTAAKPSQEIEKPILRLYQLLQSPAYRNRFDSVQAQVERMFADLIGGDALKAMSAKSIKMFEGISDHDKVVELLKSKRFFELSNHWDDEWIEWKINKIAAGLQGQNANRLAA